jgi:hypothetical protein
VPAKASGLCTHHFENRSGVVVTGWAPRVLGTSAAHSSCTVLLALLLYSATMEEHKPLQEVQCR